MKSRGVYISLGDFFVLFPRVDAILMISCYTISNIVSTSSAVVWNSSVSSEFVVDHLVLKRTSILRMAARQKNNGSRELSLLNSIQSLKRCRFKQAVYRVYNVISSSSPLYWYVYIASLTQLPSLLVIIATNSL